MEELPSLLDLELSNNTSDNYNFGDYKVPDEILKLKEGKLAKAQELKEKELYRKGELQYEEDGSLIHDSDAMIRIKELANAGIRTTDWLLEASENIADFGQGDLIDITPVTENIDGT